MTGNQLKAYKKIVKKNGSAFCFVQRGVSKMIYPRIFNFMITKDACEILEKEFKGSNKLVFVKF